MLFFSLNIANDVPLQIPADVCCNCGATGDVQGEITNLKKLPYLGFGGGEITVPIVFPYCTACRPTARRHRPHIFGILVLSALVASVLLAGWLFAAGALVDSVPFEVVVGVAAVIGLATVVGYFATRKRSGAQTSHYQPVRLIDVTQKWPADITGMVLGFSNEAYRTRFAAANRGVIEKGLLRVRAL